MSDGMDLDREYSRRKFLAMGGAIAATGTLGPWIDPLAAGGSTRWPNGRLGEHDALRVKESEFMPVAQFERWTRELDRLGPMHQRGLRATGSPAHEHYIDEVRDRLVRAGVTGMHFEEIGMRRWTTETWSLELLDGQAAGPVRTASYIPYSGQTPPGGISGPLVYVHPGLTPAPGSLAGKIALVDVTLQVLPLSFYRALAWPGATYDPHNELTASRQLRRPFLNDVVDVRARIRSTGAAGVVAVIDYTFEGVRGSYWPYDSELWGLPGVYVDRDVGATLKNAASAGTRARLTLPAKMKKVSTRNLIGFIPGRSSELVMLNSHTDGTNGLEEMGPGPVIAISQYLARLPRRALPRTVLVLLTTGHFYGGLGARDFRKRHAHDLVRRINAGITIEHLGAREWDEVRPRHMGPTGRHETSVVWAPDSKALIDATFAALRRAGAFPAAVDKPLRPDASGRPNDNAWAGEGAYLYAPGVAPNHITDANYIPAPTYLLSWGVKTFDKIDHHRVRALSIAFTETILRLAHTPRHDLTT